MSTGGCMKISQSILSDFMKAEVKSEVISSQPNFDAMVDTSLNDCFVTVRESNLTLQDS